MECGGAGVGALEAVVDLWSARRSPFVEAIRVCAAVSFLAARCCLCSVLISQRAVLVVRVRGDAVGGHGCSM